MNAIKSPGGSNFPYYYKGGELHSFKFGSFFKDEKGLLEVMQAEEEFLMKSGRRIGVWVDFYETRMTDTVLGEFLQSIDRLQPRITKLAIVGLSSMDKKQYRRLEKKLGIKFSIPVQFYNNPETAKTWLVGGGV